MRRSLWLLCLWPLLIQAEHYALGEFWQQRPDQATLAHQHALRVAAPAEPIAQRAGGPIQIAVVHPSLQVTTFWDRAVRTIEARLKEAGLDAEFTLFASRRSDYRLQVAQLQEALALKPDYLLFHLDSVRHRAALEHLLLQPDAPKVILQNITTPVRNWHRHPFMYVGFDHEKGSRLLAEGYLQLAGKSGEYAVIYGPQGYVSQARANAFIDHLSRLSQWKMVEGYYTDNESSSAQEVTARILDHHPQVAFIYACSTDVALGAAEVIADRGLGAKVLINGWGGGPLELAALQSGKLDLTVMRINDDHGVAIAEAIILDRIGHPKRVPQVFSGDFELLLGRVGEGELAALTARAHRYSDE